MLPTVLISPSVQFSDSVDGGCVSVKNFAPDLQDLTAEKIPWVRRWVGRVGATQGTWLQLVGGLHPKGSEDSASHTGDTLL